MERGKERKWKKLGKAGVRVALGPGNDKDKQQSRPGVWAVGMTLVVVWWVVVVWMGQ